MSTPETPRNHRVVDTNGALPFLAGGQIVMPGPIRCLNCDASQDQLMENFRDHGRHQVEVVDGNVVVVVAT